MPYGDGFSLFELTLDFLIGDDRFFYWKHLFPLSFRQLPLQQSHTAMGAFYIQR